MAKKDAVKQGPFLQVWDGKNRALLCLIFLLNQ